MISGPDGTGKSTITNALLDYYKQQNLKAETVWLRFNHYIAKFVNIVGRLLGKSYYEEYSWGKVGYHDYQGMIGYFYIFAVYCDHLIFRYFIRTKYLDRNNMDVLIIDRYILDIMADLIVDTAKKDLVITLFSPFFYKEQKHSEVFILKCNEKIVMSRRKDIKDDKSYKAKVEAYDFLAKTLSIQELDTGVMSVNELVKFIAKA